MNGSRHWEYGPPALSIEDVAPPAEPPAADTLADNLDRLGDRLEAALGELPAWQRLGARALAEAVAHGLGWEEAGEALGFRRGRLAALRDDLAAALRRVTERAGVAT